MASGAKRPRIVIVGAGFGGINAARALAGRGVEILMIDRTNHHVFQPLLYQVATAALAPSDIASPVRAMLRHDRDTTVIMGEVSGVDTVRHVVIVEETGEFEYDYLILATGAAYSWFGHDEWAAHATVLKSLSDADMIRQRLLSASNRRRATLTPTDCATADLRGRGRRADRGGTRRIDRGACPFHFGARLPAHPAAIRARDPLRGGTASVPVFRRVCQTTRRVRWNHSASRCGSMPPSSRSIHRASWRAAPGSKAPTCSGAPAPGQGRRHPGSAPMTHATAA